MVPLAMGATVWCSKLGVECLGTVRYFGRPFWDTDGAVHFGLELSEDRADADGTQRAVHYFEAQMARALYVQAHHVTATQATSLVCVTHMLMEQSSHV